MASEPHYLNPTTTTTTTDPYSRKYVVNLRDDSPNNQATGAHETQELESAIISINLPPSVFTDQQKLSTIFKTITNALKVNPTKGAIPGETDSPDKQEKNNTQVGLHFDHILCRYYLY